MLDHNQSLNCLRTFRFFSRLRQRPHGGFDQFAKDVERRITNENGSEFIPHTLNKCIYKSNLSSYYAPRQQEELHHISKLHVNIYDAFKN